MKKITSEIIQRFEPCEDRFDNWLKYYKDFNGSIEEFLKLDKITFKDKIWVGIRLLDRKKQIEFSCQCVELVLPIYEKYNRNSNVLKAAIVAARNVIISDTRENKDTADAAADAAYDATIGAYGAPATARDKEKILNILLGMYK